MRFFIIVVSLIFFNINVQGVIEDTEPPTNSHTTQLDIEESIAKGRAIVQGMHDKLVDKLELRDNLFRLRQLAIFKWISDNEGHQDILEIAHKIVHPSLLIPAEVKQLLLIESTDKSECLGKLLPIFGDTLESLKTLRILELQPIISELVKMYNGWLPGILDKSLETRKKLLEDTVIIDTNLGAYCTTQENIRKLLEIDEYGEYTQSEKNVVSNNYVYNNIEVEKSFFAVTDNDCLKASILNVIPESHYYLYSTETISLWNIKITMALHNVEILRPSRTNDTIYAKYHEIKYMGKKHKDCISELHQDPELQNLKEEINIFENSFKPTRYSYLLQLQNLENPDDA